MPGQGLLPSGGGQVKTKDLVHPRVGIGGFVAAVDGYANGGIELPGDIRTVLERDHRIAVEPLVRQVLYGAGGVNDLAGLALRGDVQDPRAVCDSDIEEVHGGHDPGCLEEQGRGVEAGLQACGERAGEEIAGDIADPRDAVKGEHSYVERAGGGGGAEDDDSRH